MSTEQKERISGFQTVKPWNIFWISDSSRVFSDFLEFYLKNIANLLSWVSHFKNLAGHRMDNRTRESQQQSAPRSLVCNYGTTAFKCGCEERAQQPNTALEIEPTHGHPLQTSTFPSLCFYGNVTLKRYLFQILKLKKVIWTIAPSFVSIQY